MCLCPYENIQVASKIKVHTETPKQQENSEISSNVQLKLRNALIVLSLVGVDAELWKDFLFTHP